MELSIRELNEIIYALGVAEYKGMFVDKDTNTSAGDKVRNELDRMLKAEEGRLKTIKAAPTEVSKEIEQLVTKVITPITDTGSDVADFLIAVTAELPVPTEEVVETVKKAKFPGAKKSNLMDPEK
jgi:hypothetical protein